MEKEYSTITDDGRIIQKDNAYFKGRELAKVNPEEIEDAVRYFSKSFSDLEKYTEATLEVLIGDDERSEKVQRLEQLKSEVISANGIGDFDMLLGKVNAAIASHGDDSEEEKSPEISKGDVSRAESPEDRVSETAEDETTSEEKPVAPTADKPEDGSVDEKPENTPSGKGDDASEEESEVEISETLNELVELTKKAKEFSAQSDFQFVQHELDNIRFKWKEIIDADETLLSETGYKQLLKQREEAERKFAEKKAAYREKRRERKKDNLGKRAKILDQLQDVIDKKKWQAIKQVNTLTARWEEIKDLPDDDTVKEQDKKIQELLGEFNTKKVDFLVKKAQKEEENLAGKLAVLDKLEQLTNAIGSETSNWDQLDAEVEELSRQWRKIGKVSLEQSSSIWDRFKAVRGEYFNKKFEFNESFRKETTKNIRKKTRLCEEAEAILKEDDLAIAVREINNLHKRWKKIGPIPKEKNDELWERFNVATRKFNEVKSENLDTIRQQEKENYDKKVALCEKAESLKDSTEWDAVSLEMEELMKSWREVGPVPRRKAGKIWKRFKTAMDIFYDKRREHFREVRSDQKNNYEKKREVIAELEKLAEHEDAEEAVRLAKDLQEAFKKIGFVPIKKKNKIETDYKQVCDRIYQRVRGKGKQDRAVGKDFGGAGADKSRKADFFKLKKECDKLHEEILRYEDTKTFINPGGKGNALIDEIQQKIEKSKEKLESKQEKLEELRNEMEK